MRTSMQGMIPIFAAFFIQTALGADLMLAQEYKDQDIAGWAMSEKLDGVRAYWDGRQLVSRQGYAFTPPKGFTAQFPPYPLDGELYSGRGQFEQISAAVRSSSGDWRGIRLHVFDVPKAQGNLHQRLAVATQWLKTHPNAPITIIPANQSARPAARDGLFKTNRSAGRRRRDAAPTRIAVQRRQKQPIIEAEKPIRRRMHGNAAL